MLRQHSLQAASSLPPYDCLHEGDVVLTKTHSLRIHDWYVTPTRQWIICRSADRYCFARTKLSRPHS